MICKDSSLFLQQMPRQIVKMYKYNKFDQYQSVQELQAFWQAIQVLGKASYRSAYEWLDNVMYKYAKFDVVQE